MRVFKRKLWNLIKGVIFAPLAAGVIFFVMTFVL